jgi:pSer/pThr/pTyr-binding forkhead associated (FHA) protein
MYKYNCRKCPIRNRCIDESENSPSIKEMLRHAFDARTDTLKAWDRLQRNCLLLKAEQERAKQGPGESLLSRRLRETRAAKEQAGEVAPSPEYLRPVTPSSTKPLDERPKLKPLPSVKPKLKPLPSASRPPLKPLPSSSKSEPEITEEESALTPLSALSTTTDPAASRASKGELARPHWLTINNTGRHITLPMDGELVLGRFDPAIGVPPDIDLTYEDQGINMISRRHARIAGVEGRHVVEDLGSRHGVFVNNKQLRSGHPQSLKPGDRVALGKTQLIYDVVPTPMLMPSPHWRWHVLTITPTGRRLNIGPPTDVIIGRADTYIGFKPDLDLSQDGEVAGHVSRRHALISWRDNLPYVEDLGSGFGTRLNGETLLMGRAIPLKPGDHLWLGGCVLAYDVEL